MLLIKKKLNLQISGIKTLIWSPLTHSHRLTIEKKWRPIVQRKLKIPDNASKKPTFVLAMFPYPSGRLHMGHLRVYTVADVLARFYAAKGEHVIFPMGWDAFGLPAENAAIDRDSLPDEWTYGNIKTMRNQLTSDMMLSIDWSREFATCHPNYYKWTQLLFVKLFKAGLAYQRLAMVNWDPVDKTVLANELVDGEGKSWRSGAVVETRPMRQWYFRTLSYSKSLMEGLKEVKGQQWRDVIHMQKGWLGDLKGVAVEFDLQFDPAVEKEMGQDCLRQGERLAVHTLKPGLAASGGLSFISVGPQHLFWNQRFRRPVKDRGSNASRKLILTSLIGKKRGDPRKVYVVPTDVSSPYPEKLAISAKHLLFSSSLAGNELKQTTIPLVYDPNLLNNVEYETAIELGIPAINMNHKKIADFLKLPPPLASVSNSQHTKGQKSDITIVSSPITQFNGLELEDANTLAVKMLQGPEHRVYQCSRHRKDWLVSRQRYWATPIPLVHCSKCGTVPISESDLPVQLPSIQKAFKRGEVPLRDDIAWRSTTCPECGGPADRETDTLDTFVDSSWYYLRFLDPQNSHQMCDPAKAKANMPVDVYVGGVEHAIRHLFYARFVAHFLYDKGVMPCREPFLRFLPIGLVLGLTFTSPVTGRFFPSDQVEYDVEGKPRCVKTGEQLTGSWEKMSKSKLNGVEPGEVVRRHGLELTRLTMLASVGPHTAREWNEDEILRGVKNWQFRLWKLISNLTDFANLSGSSADESICWPSIASPDFLSTDPSFCREYTRIILQVNHHYGHSFVLSAVISNLQKLTNILLKHSIGKEVAPSRVYLKALGDLIVLLQPIAPVFACELWEGYRQAVLSSPVSFQESLSQIPGWTYNLEKDVTEQLLPEK